MANFEPVQISQMPRREKIVQRLWELARPLLFNYTLWFARKWRLRIIRCVARIGGGKNRCYPDSVSLSRKCRIDYPWRLTMGEKSSLGEGAWVYCLDNITIGKNCCIGEDVRLLSGSHDVSSPHFDLVTKPIMIHDNVWIATGAIILPGVTIGEGAVVAAGAVVTKDVEAWTVVGGNPAKAIKERKIIE